MKRGEVLAMTLGVLQTALRGLQQNQRRFDRAADDVVRSTLGTPAQGAPDLLDASVRLLTARHGLEACLVAARSGDELLGSLIDVLA
jgi:hypothetical protein